MRKFFAPMAAVVLLALVPLTTADADSPAVPQSQTRCFALAYTLRACDLRAQDYVETIQALQSAPDDEAAKAETARKSRETPALRRTQGIAYTQAAKLLSRMGAPPALHDWAVQTAALLNAPLAYDRDARDTAKKDPAAAQVLAELSEIAQVRTSSDEQQPSLAVWLKLTGGAIAIWTADVGSFEADLHRAAETPGPSRLIGKAALRLLLKAPPDTPSTARGELSELAPTGGGNLQDLPGALPQITPHEKISRAYAALMAIYVPGKPLEK